MFRSRPLHFPVPAGGCSVPLDVLAASPMVMSRLLFNYGRYLYRAESPKYMYSDVIGVSGLRLSVYRSLDYLFVDALHTIPYY